MPPCINYIHYNEKIIFPGIITIFSFLANCVAFSFQICALLKWPSVWICENEHDPTLPALCHPSWHPKL